MFVMQIFVVQAKLNQLSERLGETVTLSPEICSSPNDPLSARKESSRKGRSLHFCLFSNIDADYLISHFRFYYATQPFKVARFYSSDCK